MSPFCSVLVSAGWDTVVNEVRLPTRCVSPLVRTKTFSCFAWLKLGPDAEPSCLLVSYALSFMVPDKTSG